MSENRVFMFTIISALCLTLATTVYNYRQINEFENKYNANVNSANSSNPLNPANKINLEELKNLRDRIKSLHHETLTLTDKFNSAVLDANRGRSSDAQARLTQINKQLDENLKQVEIDFGMKTTRVSRLFQIYKHNYLKNYFTLSKDKQNEYQINFFTIFEKLLNSEQADINDFDVFMASVFLDNRKQYFPDPDLIKRISSNIDNKLISSAIDKLKDK